eukprot:CAMPEP_0119414240 /NCGR_PEP_ID=MMETSP1335-20130426/6689_1 /TAXON_ID=259385 /ORGANISM="Chrysoculter rhomboideus, Strain RCC1486" /LENGTH=59 /DNA_ID=CAMNT_0007439105 /DNA_START=59 /DNA_END=235 /DNA_ORIENTATION=-
MTIISTSERLIASSVSSCRAHVMPASRCRRWNQIQTAAAAASGGSTPILAKSSNMRANM